MECVFNPPILSSVSKKSQQQYNQSRASITAMRNGKLSEVRDIYKRDITNKYIVRFHYHAIGRFVEKQGKVVELNIVIKLGLPSQSFVGNS